MVINIRRLLQHNAQPLEGQCSLDFSATEFSGFSVRESVQVRYVFRPRNGEIVLQLALEAELAALCARCAQPLTQSFGLEKEFTIAENDLAEEFPELPITQGGKLDMQELAYGELVMEVPSVLLCNEECDGLCSVCGALSQTCECKSEPEMDPRFQVLKQLLSEDSEES